MSVLLNIFSLFATTDQSSDGDGFWFSLVAIAAIYVPVILYDFIKSASEDRNEKDTFTHSNSTTSQDNAKRVEELEPKESTATTVTRSIQTAKTDQASPHSASINTVDLSNEQRRIYDIMESSYDNLFITGKAGTGKSVLLQYFVNNTDKEVAVVAPTGIAAINVGGQTIHSFFELDPGVQNTDDLPQVQDTSNEKIEILKNLDVLVVDEISMVRADIMDMIDVKLQYARKTTKPFGGCQIIVFGDLYQLPPVVSDGQASRYIEDRYKTIYYFGATNVRKHPFRIIELKHIFRQSEKNFIDILNSIRTGQIDTPTLSQLNKSCTIPPHDDKFITLTGDNSTASKINRQELDKLTTKEYVYDGEIEGDLDKASMPTDLHLHLKVGAHIIMVKNDHKDTSNGDRPRKQRWVNGTFGIVSYLDRDGIRVKINGVEHWIDRENWDKYQYEYDATTKKLKREIVARFTQYPVKLAYAMTIHKSQGQTYESVKVDLSRGAFASGQAYVALSRCRSLASLYFARPLQRADIKVSQEVLRYMREPSERQIDKIYRIVNVKQRSDEWYDIRRNKITGSNAYLLRNHSVKYARGKNNGDDSFVNDAMARGLSLEPEGLAAFEQTTGYSVERVGFIDSLKYRDAGFSPDGIIVDNNGKIKSIVEHKAFGPAHHLSCYEHVDTRIMYQIQFGMFVTGASDAYLVLYNPDLEDCDKRLLIKHIYRDNYIQFIFAQRFKHPDDGETIYMTSDGQRLSQLSLDPTNPPARKQLWQKPIASSGWREKEVCQYDDHYNLIATYSSISEAARTVGVDRKCVSDAINGKQKRAAGYYWKRNDIAH